MKRVMVLLVMCCLVLGGCSSGVSQKDYDAALEENGKLKEENEKLSKEIKDISAQKSEIEKQYNEYKETMKDYEGLKQDEAEAREIAAKKAIEEQKAADEQKKAEEAAQKEQEEKAGYDTGITYDGLARTPDDYKGKKVKFTGKVVQSIENTSTIQIRLAVDSDYNSMLLCQYNKSIVQSRVLEDDIITIYGTSTGLITYQSTMGGSITIPGVSIDKIEQ